MGESTSIVRYLSEKYGSSSQWIPKDLKKRAQVNAMLDYYHSSLRICAARTFWYGFMAPVTGMKVDPALAKDTSAMLRAALKFINSQLSKTRFVANDELSFADIIIYCEIRQLDLVNYDYSPYPALVAWMDVLAKLPHHNEVHDVLFKLKTSVAAKQKGAASSPSSAKL